jgi:PD-(D/E)XK nuclease superfamily
MPDATIDRRYRQSRIRSFTECPRRCVLDTEWTAGLVGESAALGSALHAVVAEILRTLKAKDEPQMPTQEAVEVMYEVIAAGTWVLSPESLDWLLQMVLKFCEYEIQPSRILAIEELLTADICCPDGEVRTLSGTPDLLVADPGRPPGIAIEDWKSSLGVPRSPRVAPPEGEPIVGEVYLHEGGHTQLRIYGYLALKRYPRAQYVTLRQRNLRWGGPPREASITRDDLEHIERQIGLLMMQLDEALREGEGHELAAPRPGPWCASRCAVARSCPVPREMRGLGVLETPADAAAEAERWTMIRALDKQMRAALKVWVESTDTPVPVGDELLTWHDKPNGGREFCLKAAA